MTQLATLIEREQRRTNGVFYTPDVAARAIVEWSVRSPADRVMDPAVGGGVFLSAAHDRLQNLGMTIPGRQLMGADIDRDAVHGSLGPKLGIPTSNLRLIDFLTLSPSDISPVDVVVGNPPWVRHHALSSAAKRAATQSNSEATRVSGRSGYWVYFLLHAMRFLRPDGRLGMLLPWSFKQADYASDIRVALAAQFRLIDEFVIHERLFEALDQPAIMLLAEGFGRPFERWRTIESRFLPDLTDRRRDANATSRMSDRPTRNSVTFGDIAQISIGLVTGANRFFVLRPSRVRELHLPTDALTATLSRRRHLVGIDVTSERVNALLEADEPLYLVTPAESTRTDAVLHYLGSEAAEEARRHFKCRQRVPWYQIPIPKSADAFLSYFGSDGPILASNKAKVQATNTLYEIRWKSPNVDSASAALGLMSTLGQLSAEVHGRPMASGGLKLEPSDVRRLVIPMVNFPRRFVLRVDRRVARGDRAGARHLVDEALLRAGEITRNSLDAAREQLSELRSWRHRDSE